MVDFMEDPIKMMGVPPVIIHFCLGFPMTSTEATTRAISSWATTLATSGDRRSVVEKGEVAVEKDQDFPMDFQRFHIFGMGTNWHLLVVF